MQNNHNISTQVPFEYAFLVFMNFIIILAETRQFPSRDHMQVLLTIKTITKRDNPPLVISFLKLHLVFFSHSTSSTQSKIMK